MSPAMEPVSGTGSFDSATPEEPFPGIVREAFTTARATVTRYTFEPGASFPRHSHAQEQITLVATGAIEVEIEGEVETLRPGDWSVVEPGVEHGITAGPDGARIVAIVSPARSRSDEYELSGEDA
ncbi:MAG: cupin domain-containing protein [Solirubrobacterales bacterium]|nr:cupin domain-containing protein [Solirubrobacterales bacterium]